jgi:hypothetical protein
MQFSPYLFWDTDPTTIDWDKHARYVMTRVLCRGTLEDLKKLIELYGRDRISREIVQVRYLDKRTLNFCSVIFDIPKEKFRCYTLKQSNLSHWDY